MAKKKLEKTQRELIRTFLKFDEYELGDLFANPSKINEALGIAIARKEKMLGKVIVGEYGD